MLGRFLLLETPLGPLACELLDFSGCLIASKENYTEEALFQTNIRINSILLYL